ncbi:MAG TPA: TetR/AcrR family transcriptional regulator [Deltaproteobacteria bacterium]|nr:TetR/AcrR family transcriptional regulator [Deltaproteobacteria bacterium]
MARRTVQRERRLQILKALDTCIQEKSFERTTIRDIARAAGVNHGVLHYYFRDKEEILLAYIDYVMDDYSAQARQWLGGIDPGSMTRKAFLEEVFAFVNHRITLNLGLSRVFVEIWEIALYHPQVRDKLRQAYARWIDELSSIVCGHAEDTSFARNVCVAMVAFWEGMALFSTLFGPDELSAEEVLAGFQQRITDLL